MFRDTLNREIWIGFRASFSFLLAAYMSKRVHLRFPLSWSPFMLLVV